MIDSEYLVFEEEKSETKKQIPPLGDRGHCINVIN
jgi:hypothetical protein